MMMMMTGTWIALVLFSNTLSVQVLPQEFPNEKECLNWKNITITKKKIQQHHFICVPSVHMKGNDVSRMITPLIILLPTPS
jgi:hypothetical protein|tara:strand:- start:1103 stop:1345 length:243 start_codon:yes stop_codon:yes gene_type:complete